MSDSASAQSPVFRRFDVGNDLPVNKNGILRRSAILERYGLADWTDRPTLAVFAGSRPGKNPAYKLAAEELSRWTNARGIGLVTGGAPDKLLGLMSAVADHNDHLIGVGLRMFADRKGVMNSGISPRAINFITDDFYPRKVMMDLPCDMFIELPGGLGTFEETTEALIFGAKHGKAVHICNINGLFDPTLAQIQTLISAGLIRVGGKRSERDIGRYTVSPTPEALFASIEEELRALSRQTDREAQHSSDKIKPGRSLQSHLSENPHLILDRVLKFNAGRPRIGVVVSGNISEDSQASRLNNRALTKEFCEQSRRLGREIAQGGGVLVLSGGRYGLREIMAEAALAEGGSVIWIQKDGKLREPLHVSSYDRELTFTVAREFEKAMLFDLFSQSTGVLPGGIHTLDRILEIMTREMTFVAGIRSYPFMLGEDSAAIIKTVPDRPANSVMGYNLGGLWSDTLRQIEVFHKEGFIEDRHLDLLRVLDPKDSLAQALIANARAYTRQSYDLLEKIHQLSPRKAHRPALPGRPAPDALIVS